MSKQETNEIGFIVRNSSDEAYELLSPEDQTRVDQGQQIVIENSGLTRVLETEAHGLESDLEEGIDTIPGEQKTTVPAGTFSFVSEDVVVPYEIIDLGDRTVRVVDISGVDRKLARFGSKLNGSTPRADSLVRTSLAEALTHHGIIKGSMVLDGAVGVQSNEPNEGRRVAAFFTVPQSGRSDAYILARASYADYGSAARAVQARI